MLSRVYPWLVLSVAGLKLLVHLYASHNYGYFVDELYYIACGRHLDWGYVDQPPLIAAIAKLVGAVLGYSLPALRFLPAVAGAALVAMTGYLARELGGGLYAQAIASLCALTAPGLLAAHSLFTMNAFEPLFWIACAYLLVRIINTGDHKLWLWIGVAVGLGL